MKKRTTITLDADVAEKLDREMHRVRRPFKQVVNDAIRRGLAPSGRTAKLPPFKVKPFHARLLPGVDPLHLNRLADQLEDEAIVARLRRGQRRR